MATPAPIRPEAAKPVARTATAVALCSTTASAMPASAMPVTPPPAPRIAARNSAPQPRSTPVRTMRTAQRSSMTAAARWITIRNGCIEALRLWPPTERGGNS